MLSTGESTIPFLTAPDKTPWLHLMQSKSLIMMVGRDKKHNFGS